MHAGHFSENKDAVFAMTVNVSLNVLNASHNFCILDTIVFDNYHWCVNNGPIKP